MTGLRWIVGRARADRELEQEIQAHIAERIDDLVEAGKPVDDARRTALREFGDPMRCLEDSRAVWTNASLVGLDQDVRHALRTIRRQPLFSVSVVLLLAFGVGLVTSFFTIFSVEVFRPWPVPDSASVVVIKPLPAVGERYGTLSSLEYRYFREHSHALSQVAASFGGGGPIGRRDGTAVASVQWQFVTANYFDALRVGMTIGRGFLPEEEDYAAPRAVAIVSERAWRVYFGSDPALVGSAIRVGKELMTVVGVVATGFTGLGENRIDLYRPLPTVGIAHDRKFAADYQRKFEDPRWSPFFWVFGRLRTGVTAQEARAELDVLSHRFREPLGMEAPGVRLADTRLLSAEPEMARAHLRQESKPFGVLLVIMLLTCANAGNLVLAKTVARREEIAVRLSLGASRWRVARQLLTEMLLLSLVAGAVALCVAAAVPSLMSRLLGNEIRNYEHLRPDALVFLFALLMSMLACALASLGPILQSARAAALGRGGDTVLVRSSSRVLRASLLGMQIAISTVLLVGAGLLTRAVSRAMTIDPVFAVAGMREMRMVLPPGAPDDALSRVREALAASDLPPMAFSNLTPITSSRPTISVRFPGEDADKNRVLTLRSVSANYFRLLGIPLQAGRPFDERTGGRELVVNRSAARLLWRGDNPIGKQLVNDGADQRPELHEIVGMVADVPTTALTMLEPVIYYPAGQWGSVAFVRDLSPVVPARVEDLVRRVVPGASLVQRPLADAIRESLNNGGSVAWGIGLAALLLAMQGAFAVFALMVEERRREIGIRMAFGAGGSEVVGLVLRSATRPVLAGLAVGLALSLMLAPVLRQSLYGLSPFDPAAYLGIAAILLASSLAATWVPARRATRVEPAITLRDD